MNFRIAAAIALTMMLAPDPRRRTGNSSSA